ncbi:MAG: efflux transporter outer membrane subunit [Magnetococcales bacterium]|nr:efflux transporter outer membrane subunit [Magnetococcales bacterium]
MDDHGDGNNDKMAPVSIMIQRLGGIAGCALALCGCAVGPDYQPPVVEVPTVWHADRDLGKTARIRNDAQWWSHFNDPTLTRLLDQAASGNLDLKMATARVVQARAGMAQARAAGLPGGDFRASATREANQMAMPGGNSTPLASLSQIPFDIFQTGFDASWELDLFGSHRRAEEGATAQWEGALAARADVWVSLLAEIARTYVAIRRDQRQRHLLAETIAVHQKMVILARQRFQAGQVAHMDVVQAEARGAQVQSTLPNLNARLRQNEYSMDVLLGERPGVTHELLANPAPIPTLERDLVWATPVEVIARRADIRVAERKLAAATAQQGIATARFFPNLSLSGFFGFLGTDAADLMASGQRSWRADAGIRVPVFNLGFLAAQWEVANARQQEALASYQKSIFAALADVERALTAYNQQEVVLRSALHEVEKDQQVRDIARERFQQGTTSQLEVLEAERTLLASRDRLANARADCTLDLIAVYKSLGGGWERPVGPDLAKGQNHFDQ